MTLKNSFKVTNESPYLGVRLDKALAEFDKNYSRTYFANLCKTDNVLINKKKPKSPHYILELNDVVSYSIITQEPFYLTPIKGNLDIAYEDNDCLVINKPQGLVVHPAPGHKEDTLVNLLIGKVSSLSNEGGEFRPGIVHRIDKDTSGLLLIAKTNLAHAFFSNLLKTHEIKREYYAIVEGIIYEDEGKIIAPIGRDKKFRQKMCVDTRDGKDAITYFKVLKRYKDKTLIACKLETGRTHQIRVHLAYIEHPVVGDPLYNKKKYPQLNGQLLHAYRLTFPQPTTKKEIVVTCEIPENFTKYLDSLQ